MADADNDSVKHGLMSIDKNCKIAQLGFKLKVYVSTAAVKVTEAEGGK